MGTIDVVRHAVADDDLTADEGFRLLSSMAGAGSSLRLPRSAAEPT